MNPRAFDALARRASHALNRRAALGLLTGTLLASALRPAGACKPGHSCGGGKNGGKGHGGGGKGDGHGNDGHGGGNNNKKNNQKGDEKKCKVSARKCRNYFLLYCTTYFGYDPLVFAVCFDEFNRGCCIPVSKCHQPADFCTS